MGAHLSLKQKPGNHDLRWFAAIVFVFACIITHGITKHEFESKLDALKTEYQNNCTIMQTQFNHNLKSSQNNLSTAIKEKETLRQTIAGQKKIITIQSNEINNLSKNAIALQEDGWFWTYPAPFDVYGWPSNGTRTQMETEFQNLKATLRTTEKALKLWKDKKDQHFVQEDGQYVMALHPTCKLDAGRGEAAYRRMRKIEKLQSNNDADMAHLRQVTEMLRKMLKSKNITPA